MTATFPVPGSFDSRVTRGATFRKAVLTMAVAGAVALAGFGGYIYYRNNSVSQLASRAQLALEQHDPVHAVDYLQRALQKHPHGETGVGLRLLMARAMLEQEREQDARDYLKEALDEKPDSYDALDLLARTYVTPVYSSLRKKPKPISPSDAQSIYQQIDGNLGSLAGMPATARNLVAQSELHRLYYMILNDQARQALAQLDAATLTQNLAAASQAQTQVASVKQPLEEHRQASLEKLEQALKAEPAHAGAAGLLSQYEYQDEQYDRAMALYEQMKQRDAAAVPEEVALGAARSILADAKRRPDKGARLADARALLDDYLKSHPKSVRSMVALGDVLLDQGQVAEAVKLGERAATESPNELFAQILLVNCRLREKKTEEALRLISPLTTAFDNRPEVWYLQGLASVDAGDTQAAENAFRKAFAVSPGFIQARRALLELQTRSGNTEGASMTASQLLREDRYDMAAWRVTAENLRKHGQIDRARQVLVNLAGDRELPMESRPELVRMLAYYGAGNEAQALLATLPKDDKTTLNLRALVASARGNGVDARNLMAQAVAADPQDIDLRLRYAELLAQAGLAADFRAQLDAIVATHKNLSADQTLALARNYLRVRLPSQAVSLLKPLVEKQPALPEAHELAKQAQSMLTGGGGAIAEATNGMEIDVRTASMSDLVRYASNALQQKKFDVALGVARAGSARDRANPAFHQIAARALAGLQQIDQAVEEAATAAALEPNRPEGYQTFVELFPTADSAIKGLTYGNRFDSLNAALGAWATGQLAEVTGQYDLALKYYNSGLEATSRLIDPRPAKDQLYQAIIGLHAQRKDAAALRKAADSLAQADGGFAPGIRLLACDKLIMLGDREAAAQQLDAIAAKLGKSPQPRLVLSTTNRWLALNAPEKALSLMESQVAAAPEEPEFLDAYATLLTQTGKLDKALEVRTKLCKLSPGEPQYRVLLANVQAASGDLPASFRTLDDAAGLGATGKQLAKTARIRQLIALGLLTEAGDELKAGNSTPGADDFASMLAVAQAWAQLNKADEARKMAAVVPAYAAEYVGAQVLIASMELDKGDHAGAIKSLSDLLAKNPSASPQIAPPLFLAYLRAGDSKSALDLAGQQKSLYLENTPQSRYWTTLAATAAREGGQYDVAIRTLNTLDADSRRAATFDIALMQLLQNKPDDAAAAAGALADDGPAFNRSTLLVLAGKPIDAAVRSKLLSQGLMSSVIAVLSSTPPDQIAQLQQQAAQNPHLFPADLDALIKGLGNSAGATLHTIALAQRLLEAGWTTTALELADAIEKQTPNLPAIAVMRHQALTDLHRTVEADALRDALIAKAQSAPNSLTPSIRILLAAAWAKQEKYTEAIAVLQPLAATNRTDILTTLAALHEKNGQLDQAIALHRQVRKLDAEDISAANNLAYTLVASKPTDKAALAEARKAIEFAIAKAPQVTAFQDTLGWIEILSGQAAEGTRRIARASGSLRLDPAVHYHLGMGYARLGQNDFARMHLQNVAHLAQNHKSIPELPLATEALRTLASMQ